MRHTCFEGIRVVCIAVGVSAVVGHGNIIADLRRVSVLTGYIIVSFVEILRKLFVLFHLRNLGDSEGGMGFGFVAFNDLSATILANIVRNMCHVLVLVYGLRGIIVLGSSPFFSFSGLRKEHIDFLGIAFLGMFAGSGFGNCLCRAAFVVTVALVGDGFAVFCIGAIGNHGLNDIILRMCEGMVKRRNDGSFAEGTAVLALFGDDAIGSASRSMGMFFVIDPLMFGFFDCPGIAEIAIGFGAIDEHKAFVFASSFLDNLLLRLIVEGMGCSGNSSLCGDFIAAGADIELDRVCGATCSEGYGLLICEGMGMDRALHISDCSFEIVEGATGGLGESIELLGEGFEALGEGSEVLVGLLNDLEDGAIVSGSSGSAEEFFFEGSELLFEGVYRGIDMVVHGLNGICDCSKDVLEFADDLIRGRADGIQFSRESGDIRSDFTFAAFDLCKDRIDLIGRRFNGREVRGDTV